MNQITSHLIDFLQTILPSSTVAVLRSTSLAVAKTPRSTFLWASFGFLPLYLLYRGFIWPFFLSPLRKLPGPKPSKPLLLLGNFMDILKEEAAEPQLRWAKLYGGVYRYYSLFNNPRIVVTSATGLRRVLGTHAHIYTKGDDEIRELKRLLGHGLLSVEGDVHRRQRMLLNPIFRVKHIAEMMPIFLTSSQELVQSWKDVLDAMAPATDESQEAYHEFDIYMEASKVTLDVIGRAGFGYEFGAVKGLQNPLYEAFQKMLALSSISVWRALKYRFPILYNVPTKDEKEFHASQKVIFDIVDDIIKNKRTEETVQGKPPANSGNDLLSILIKANSGEETLSDKELVGQVMTFLGAGHETTSVALSWTLYFMSIYPEVQTKLRDEINQLFDSGEPLTYERLNALPYLEAVCKETLRLRSPAAVTSRITSVDDEIDGYKIPKGTPVFLVIGAVHRLPAYWGDNADEYVPERWLNGDITGAGMTEPEGASSSSGSASKAFGAFMPFLLGPRNCIGSRFAIIELKTLIAYLLRDFKFAPVPGLKVGKKLQITLKPWPVLKLRVSRV